MPKYKFSELAYNINQKKMPEPGDEEMYIGLEHLDSGSLKVKRWGSNVPITGQKLVMKKGDILFGRRNTYLRRAAIAPHDGIFSAHGMIFRPNTDLMDPDYFPFFISSDYFMNAAIRISVGSLSPTVNWKTLKDLEFEIPDLDSQRKSAELLTAANDLKESYEVLLVQTDELVKSQFIEMFNGKGYPEKTIGEVIDKNIKRAAKVFDKTDEIQYLDISSIDNASKTVTGLTPYILKDAPSRAQYVLKAGDIMYSTVRPNLQNIAINESNDSNVVGSTGFCVLRCLGVRTGYMWGVVTGSDFTTAMVSQASGANYPAVTDKVVHAYTIPIPPIEQQIAFEKFVRQSDKSKFELKKAICDINELIKSLMQQDT